MKSVISTATVLIIAGAASAGANPIVPAFDTTVTPSWNVGSGQPNANFATGTNASAGVQVGLSSFYRFTGGQNSLVGNVYEFNAGNTFPPANTAAWNINWHINLNTTGTSGVNLGNANILLTIDWDPTAGTNFQTYNLSTSLLGLGLPASTTLVQASENLGFTYWGQAFDPNALGTYTFDLRVVQGSTVLSQINTVVNVVPAPSAAGLLGLAGLVAARRRRN